MSKERVEERGGRHGSNHWLEGALLISNSLFPFIKSPCLDHLLAFLCGYVYLSREGEIRNILACEGTAASRHGEVIKLIFLAVLLLISPFFVVSLGYEII